MFFFLSIVTRGDQQVSEDQQLVVRELLLVLLPVVVMGAPEVGQGLLHGHLQRESDWSESEWRAATERSWGEAYLYRLRVVEVSAQVHQQLGHPGGHVVGAGEDAGTQAQDASVTPHQVCREQWKKLSFSSEDPIGWMGTAGFNSCSDC